MGVDLSAFLEVRNLVKDFDGLKAVSGLDLTLEEGELLADDGPQQRLEKIRVFLSKPRKRLAG